MSLNISPADLPKWPTDTHTVLHMPQPYTLPSHGLLPGCAFGSSVSEVYKTASEQEQKVS